eukprot:gene43564-39185_t
MAKKTFKIERDMRNPRNKSGLTLVLKGTVVEIANVASGGPAERVGVRAGMRIRAVNGTELTADVGAVRTALRQALAEKDSVRGAVTIPEGAGDEGPGSGGKRTGEGVASKDAAAGAATAAAPPSTPAARAAAGEGEVGGGVKKCKTPGCKKDAVQGNNG